MVLVSGSYGDVVFLVKLYGKFNEGSEPLFNLHELGFLLMALSAKCFSYRKVELVTLKQSQLSLRLIRLHQRSLLGLILGNFEPSFL